MVSRRMALVIVGLLLWTGSVRAEDLTVMTSGAFTAAYRDLVPEFERVTGHKLRSLFGASIGGAPDSIPMRLARGEAADLVIVSDVAVDALITQGKVAPGSRIDLVRSRIGMVVRAGAPKPDISSVEALTRTLLQAKSIGYSASNSGAYLSTELFPKLGVWDQIKSKSTRVDGELVAAAVARGEVAIGFQQISELGVPGVDYVGPLPGTAQKIAIFSAGMVVGAPAPNAAREFITFLQSERARGFIIKSGLEPITSN